MKKQGNLKQITKQGKVRQFKQFKESNQYNEPSQTQTQIFSFYQNEQDLDILQFKQSDQLQSSKFNKRLFSQMYIRECANPEQMMFLVKCKKTIQMLNQRLSKIERQKQKIQKDNMNKNLLIEGLLIQKQNMQLENSQLNKMFEDKEHKINKKNFKVKKQNIQPIELSIRKQIGTQTDMYIVKNLKSTQQSLRDYGCQLHLYEINLKNQMITHLTQSYNQLQKKYSQQLLKVNQVSWKVNQLKKNNILEEGLILQKIIKNELESKKTKTKSIEQIQQRQIDFFIQNKDKQKQDKNTQISLNYPFNYHKQKQTQIYHHSTQNCHNSTQNYHKQKQTQQTVKKKIRIREEENEFLALTKEKQCFKDQFNFKIDQSNQFINTKVNLIKNIKQQEELLLKQNAKNNQIVLNKCSKSENICKPQTWSIISNSFNLLESYLQKLNTLSNTEIQ